MTLESTNRLITAVLVTATAVVVAALAGRAEAALLAAPWGVLIVLGLAGTTRDRVRARLAVGADRVMVDGTVTVEATVEGLDGGWVEAIWRPPTSFTDPPRPSVTGRDDATSDPTTASDAEPSSTGQAETDSNADRADADAAEADRDDATEDWPGTAVGEVAGPNGRTKLVCGLPARAWGSHDVGQVELRIHHRFGLTVGKGLARQTLPVRVHPHPIDLRRLLAPWHVRRLTGAHRSRTAARGIEYADIRAFGPGDSPRDINWRASARSDELWVSQRHPERSTDAVLLLDTFIESGHDLRASLGLAIEAAIGLAESHLTVSDRVGLIELGGILRWVTPGTGRHQLQRLADALLATRLYENASDRYVLAVPPRALPPRSFIVALSPLLDDRFIDALGVLRASGHDVSVIECPPFIDPVAGSLQQEKQQHAKHQEEAELADSARVAQRLWTLERSMTRDRLIEQGIAVGRWELGESLDPVLAGLAAHRDGMRARAVGLRAGHG